MAAKRRFHLDYPKERLKELLSASSAMCVGIDPGKTGGIAFLPSHGDPFVIDIPVDKTSTTSKTKGKAKKSTKTLFDHYAIHDLFQELSGDHSCRVTIGLEQGQPMPRDTAMTAFGIGIGYGMWPLYFMAMKLPFENLRPSVWKKTMGLTKAKGATDAENKTASRIMAKQMFPAAAQYFALVSDHNRAEAILLAEYLRRKIN